MVRLAHGVNSILLLGCLTSCVKEKNDVLLKSHNSQTIQLIEKNDKVYHENKLFSGKLYTLKEKDTVYKVTYLDGLKNGAEYVCYPSGKKKELREYKNGMQHGIARGWYINGKKMFEYDFKNDVFNGKYLEWYENGIMYRNQHYKNGYELGSQQVWNIDGKIKINYIIKDGRRYGLLGTKNCKNVTEILFK